MIHNPSKKDGSSQKAKQKRLIYTIIRFSRARFGSRTPALVSCQQHAVFLIFPLFLGNEKKRRKKSPKLP